MQEHLYVLYVFTVQSNGGMATTPLLVDYEDLPYSGEGPIPPFLYQNDCKGCLGNY